MIRVLVLLLLLLSLMGCSEKVRVQTWLIHEPIPESLTNETPTPTLKAPVTWGGIAIWADQLHDALDTCNADKNDIRALNLLRLARQKGGEQYAEN
ncbi:Rz1-like lysis system protein LysC [Escherichia coli]